MFPQLHVQLFGDFCLFDGSQPVTSVDTPRLQALLAYLLLHQQAPQSRQHLAFLFWPDSSEAQARANLRQLIHYLRHALPAAEHFLQFESKTIQWRSNPPFTLDVIEFERCLTQGNAAARNQDSAALRQALESAVALYRGDLLPACYDEWVLAEREAWREHFIKALERLILLLEEARDYVAAIAYAHRLLRHDPLHESTYRHLMRLYALNHERASALHTYHTCVTVLQRELGVEPHPTTQAAYARLINMPAGLDTQSAPTPHPALGTTLVGRQREWAILQRAWHRANQQGAHLVLIAGEAGIGKTRLVEELRHWVNQQGLTAAHTRSYAAEGALAYAPVIEWLRSEAFQTMLPRLDAVWLSEVARLLPELLIQQPQLPHPPPLNERWQRQRLFEALARAVLLVPQPLLLAIDDLHWCDQETLEWLHFLLRFDHKARLLIVGTARLEEVGVDHPLAILLTHLQRQDQGTEVVLGPLNAAETQTLAAQTAGHALDDATLEKLVQFTEGNPLFVVETTRIQNGAWSADVGEAQAETPMLGRQTLPPKMLAVIQHRLRQLSPVAREVASLAAVGGRSFSFAALAHASDLGEEGLAQALDELWQRRVIREQGVNTYDFSHDRIREVAYAEIGPIRRRRLHSRLAEALLRLHQNDLDEISATLASHYEQGGLVQQAIDWYQRAAAVAEQRYVYISAINYVDAALQLLLMLPQTAESLTQQLALLIAKSSQLMPLYGLVSRERTNVYQQIEAIINHVPDARLRFMARSGLRGFYGLSGRMQDAYQQAEQLLTLAHQLQEPLLYLEACQGYAMVNLQLGHFPIARHYWIQREECFALQLSDAERAEYGPITATMSYHAFALWLLGYPEQARRKMAEALTQSEIIGDPVGFSVTLFFGDLLYRHMSEIRLLGSVLEKLHTLATQHAIWLTKFEALSLQGWLAVQQGNFAQSIDQIRAEIDALKAAGHTMFQTHRLGLLIEAQLKAGQFADAWATLEKAFVISEQSGQRSFDAELYRLKGELLSHLAGAEADIALAYEQAIHLARTQSAKSLELRATISLCRLWQRQGKRTEAYQRLAELYGWFTEGFDTADLQAAKALLDALSS